MNDYRNKLMAWKPGDDGFSRDETVLAVGLQCREAHFPLNDVISWIGLPDKATGNATGGHLVYFSSGPVKVNRESEVAFVFDVAVGRVVQFGSIARYRNNAIRQDGKTHFNMIDEMNPFDEQAFK